MTAAAIGDINKDQDLHKDLTVIESFNILGRNVREM